MGSLLQKIAGVIAITIWPCFATAAIDLDLIPDKISCAYYVLPPITGTELTGNEAYYSFPAGAGQQYKEGDTIFFSTVLYAYDFEGTEADEECFYIQIISNLPDLNLILDDTVCQYKILPYFTTPAVSGFAGYYSGPLASGVRYQQGDTLWYSADLFVYDG
jgi:hypothetical protein